jgi:hypothetical protein
MIKSIRTGEKTTARRFAQEVLAEGIVSRKEAGCTDPEMTDRERTQVVEHINKLSDKLLARLRVEAPTSEEVGE